MAKHSILADIRDLEKRGRELTKQISGTHHGRLLTERRKIIRTLIEGYHLSYRQIATKIGISSSRVQQEYQKAKS